MCTDKGSIICGYNKVCKCCGRRGNLTRGMCQCCYGYGRLHGLTDVYKGDELIEKVIELRRDRGLLDNEKSKYCKVCGEYSPKIIRGVCPRCYGYANMFRLQRIKDNKKFVAKIIQARKSRNLDDTLDECAVCGSKLVKHRGLCGYCYGIAFHGNVTGIRDNEEFYSKVREIYRGKKKGERRGSYEEV